MNLKIFFHYHDILESVLCEVRISLFPFPQFHNFSIPQRIKNNSWDCHDLKKRGLAMTSQSSFSLDGRRWGWGWKFHINPSLRGASYATWQSHLLESVSRENWDVSRKKIKNWWILVERNPWRKTLTLVKVRNFLNIQIHSSTISQFWK